MSTDLREQLQASLGDAYAIERELGGGGMSRVFLARETSLGRQVVIKVLLPELAVGVSVDRFRREIQLAAQLQHPHIVPLLAAGEAAGLPYFTMPFVSGESLGARLLRDRELPVSEAVRVLRDVAAALAYAHQQGVVHRDIKPDNVLLAQGVAVVTDFGVAKAVSESAAGRALQSGTTLTSRGLALGTPAYMAPEQASADPGMDHRVDLYAFGVMAYEMLTGDPPFSGRSPQAILGAHVAVLPEPVTGRRPGIPPALAMLIMRCLEKRPADRPQTAADIIHTLDLLTTPSGGTVPVPAVHRSGAGIRSMLMRALPVAAVLLLGLAATLWMGRSRGPDQTALESVAGDSDPAAAALLPGPAAPDTDRPEDSAIPLRGERAGSSAGIADTPAPPSAAPAAPAVARPPQRRPAAEPERDSALLDRLRREAMAARGRALDAGAPTSLLARGDAALLQAESLRRDRRAAEAAVQLSAAAALWREAASAALAGGGAMKPAESAPAPVTAASRPAAPVQPPPETAASRRVPPPDAPVNPAEEVGSLIAAYARAIEARSVDAIRRLYPGLTAEAAREWDAFFSAVRDVRATLRVTALEVRGDSADAQVDGEYVYAGSDGREQRAPVAFTAALERSSGGWRIAAVR